MAESAPRSYTITPKRRGLGKTFLTMLGMLGSFAVAHILWSHVTERQLRNRIDALHAAGEPVTPEDFRSLELARPGNAASEITAAATILDDDTVYSRSVDAISATQPVEAEAWPYLRASVKWFDPALRRFDRAEGKGECSWSHRYQSPIFEHLMVPELSQCREVALLLLTSSHVEHHDGNDDLVARRLRQMLFLARAADGSPTPVAHLVSLGIIAAAAAHIEAVAPNLRIDGSATGDEPRRGVRALIAALLDESATSEGLRKSIQAERMHCLDSIESFAMDSPDVVVAAFRYVGQPIQFRAGLVTIDQCSKAATILTASSNWPTAANALQTLPAVQGLHAYADASQAIRRAAPLHFQRLADRRLAATALAIRLFIVDHQGRFPSTLEELVPAYLPAVPKDPMSAAGEPIRYLPRADHPVLYSIGTNGADDGGSEAALPGEYGELAEWQRLDRVFYLSLRPREQLIVSNPQGGGADLVAGAAFDLRTPWERHDPLTPDWRPPVNQDLRPR